MALVAGTIFLLILLYVLYSVLKIINILPTITRLIFLLACTYLNVLYSFRVLQNNFLTEAAILLCVLQV